jgi:hypothetical protein
LNGGRIATKPAVNDTRVLSVIILPTTLGLTDGTHPDRTPRTNVCGWRHNRKCNRPSGAGDLFCNLYG